MNMGVFAWLALMVAVFIVWWVNNGTVEALEAKTASEEKKSEGAAKGPKGGGPKAQGAPVQAGQVSISTPALASPPPPPTPVKPPPPKKTADAVIIDKLRFYERLSPEQFALALRAHASFLKAPTTARAAETVDAFSALKSYIPGGDSNHHETLEALAWDLARALQTRL